jgi:hypothetical protein
MLDLLQQNIAGLESKLQDLRDRKDLFMKAKGLEEEIGKARVDIVTLTDEITAEREKLNRLNAQKAAVVSDVSDKIAAAMGSLLPEGKAVFEIDGEAVRIGWDRGDCKAVPYAGLSGGQRVAFDLALAYALAGPGEKLLIMEAAEMDGLRLDQFLTHLSGHAPADAQIIVNTCHTPGSVPDGWEVTTL